MAIISFPYDSQLVDGVYDRAIKSATYRQLLSKYFTTGVFPNPSTQCQVYPSTGMKVSVRKGSANINGLYVELEEDVEATIEQADTQGRYDRIVLRHDDNNNVRATNVVVIKGTAGASPQAPSLTRNETVYDICLATVYVRAGATSISASDITDTRLNTDLCGIVSATIESIDTTTFYNQIQADLLEFKTKEKADFEEFSNTQEQAFLDWFEGIKGILGQDEAGKLLLLIQENQANIEKLQYTGNIVSGETFSGKSSNKGVKLHKVVGKTIQDGVPTPDSPVEIKNVKITEIYSNGESGIDTSTKTNTVETSLTLSEGDVYEDGVATKTKGHATFDGSSDESWVNGSVNDQSLIRFYIIIEDMKLNPNGKCNRFEWMIIPTTQSATEQVGGNSTQKSLHVLIKRSRLETEDISGFKKWLQSNPIEVEYELVTPTTEELKVPTIPSYYSNTNVWTDNTVSTDIEWEVLAESDNSLEIEEVEGNLQKPNMLDNANFESGIINQRGQTTYTITQTGGKFNYFIDRWKVWVETGRTFTCNVNSDSIDVKIEGTEKGAIQQDCNLKEGYKYVITAKIDDVIRQMIFDGGEEKQDDYFKVSGKGENGFVSIIFGNTYRNIKWVKLEEGYKFTGLPLWNKSIELLKCQSKMQRHKLNTRFYSNGAEYTQQTILLPTKMDKKPSIVLMADGEKTNISSDSITLEEDRIIWVVQPQSTGYCSIFNKDVIIDGEKY